MSEAALIALITRLEERKAAIAAEQADAILAFARAHAESRISTGVIEPEVLERSCPAVVPSRSSRSPP